MSERIRKINKLISKKIAELFVQELNMKPGVFLTIVKVDTSSDLRQSQIYVGVFPESEKGYAMKTLKNEKNALQRKLHKFIHMQPVPKISFLYSDIEVQADNIEQILRQIKDEDKESVD